MSEVVLSGPVAFLSASGSAVFFSKGSSDAGTSQSTVRGTAAPVKALQNAINVAYWGEDNRFPQNIEQQMAYCGIGKAALDWKARALWGAGIIPGRIKDYQDDGKTEVFEPLKRGADKAIYNFIEQRSMFRFFLEYLQDWTWYSNCFPEVVLSKDGKSITGLVHQESNDTRLQQMNEKGEISTAFVSKLWGAAANQYVKFDPSKKLRGLIENQKEVTEIDNKFVKAIDCIDMYDAAASLKKIAEKLNSSRKKDQLKSAILPVNYPSVNKTYYQLSQWDGARLSGWVEISSKVPSLIKQLYNKAFRIKYHIEVPETFFAKKYGLEKWAAMKEPEQKAARIALLKEMDEFLTGDENAFTSFVTFFEINQHDKTEYGRIKITPIEDKTNIDKDLITSSAADIQILIAMQAHPTLFGAGTIGTGSQRSGGSDIREAKLVYDANLNLERNVVMEPLYLVRDFNGWDSDIVFRVRDTVLTTLDKGKGTEKVVS